jgi:hypothetical protein
MSETDCRWPVTDDTSVFARILKFIFYISWLNFY